MESKNLDWKALRDQLAAKVETGYERTRGKVVCAADGLDVWPANSECDGSCFVLEDVVDFCRWNRLKCFAKTDKEHGTETKVVVLHIF